MKRIVIAIALLLFGLDTFAQVSGQAAAALGQKLDEYVDAIKAEPMDVQANEVDFIIGSCEDKDVREFVANELYRRYDKSKIMGSETVTVHIYDTWFADGKLSMAKDIDALTAQITAEFNRQSLIGCKAPELELFDRSGERVVVNPADQGRWSVLYFFDADCPKCSVESTMLQTLLNKNNFPVDVYFICTTTDMAKWDKYRFKIDAARTRTWELHDDDATFDYQLKYGILKTPRMFLTDGDGRIVGRQLTSGALERMLSNQFIAPELEYGSEESADFYAGVFAQYGHLTPADFMEVADHIEMRTLGERNDTTMYRQMMGDLLYYLTKDSSEGVKNATAEFIDAKILGRRDVWVSDDDQMKVVSLAEFLAELAGKSPIGEMVPDVKLMGTLKARHILKPKMAERSLRGIRGKENIILFYVDGCKDCAAEKAAVDGYIRANRKTRVFLVNMSDAIEADPEIMESFDLTASPYLISYDRKGIVTRKYFTIAN